MKRRVDKGSTKLLVWDAHAAQPKTERFLVVKITEPVKQAGVIK